ncbi:hypothetical protein G7046_g8705 [Stylonectria norvegica]|nr:hypothetical protein G7046_g8705 [Stylonectria norvegica]
MAEPMDEDMFSPTYPYEDPADSSEDVELWHDDGQREKELIDGPVFTALLLGYEALPEEIQKAYDNFKQSGGHSKLLLALGRSIGNRGLDNLLSQSPDFLSAAVELFGDTYPYLKRQHTGDATRLLSAAVQGVQQESIKKKRDVKGKGKEVASPDVLQLPPFTEPFKPRAPFMAEDDDDYENSDQSEETSGKARIVHGLQGTTETSKKREKRRGRRRLRRVRQTSTEAAQRGYWTIPKPTAIPPRTALARFSQPGKSAAGKHASDTNPSGTTRPGKAATGTTQPGKSASTKPVPGTTQPGIARLGRSAFVKAQTETLAPGTTQAGRAPRERAPSKTAQTKSSRAALKESDRVREISAPGLDFTGHELRMRRCNELHMGRRMGVPYEEFLERGFDPILVEAYYPEYQEAKDMLNPESLTREEQRFLAKHSRKHAERGDSIDQDIEMLDAQESGKPADTPVGDIQRPSSPDFEILGDLPQAPESPARAPLQTRSQAAYDENFVRNYLQRTGIATTKDLALHPYKGWKIDSPKINLIRAKNFLADEDIDRTVDWEGKFGELAEYFSYLIHNHQGEDWGHDLKEAIEMLHTHWVYEKYHYGRPRLNLDFPNVWPKHSRRLPPQPGYNIGASAEERPETEDMGKRQLLFNKVTGAHDAQYGFSKPRLQGLYMKEFEADAKLYWLESFLPEHVRPVREDDLSHDESERPFNMVKCENDMYEYCMRGDIRVTAAMLAGDANFQCSPSEDVVRHPDGKQTATAKSLEAFSRFRGARRAALQQCLNKYDNSENDVSCTAWRILQLPEPVVPKKDEPDAGIIFPHMEVNSFPEKAARDPFRWTVGHNWYTAEDWQWAYWVRPHAVKGAYVHKKNIKREAPIMDLPENYKGPFEDTAMDHEMTTVLETLQDCRIVLQRLRRTQKRAPRNLLKTVLNFVKAGLEGKAWENLGLQFRYLEFVQDGSFELAHLRSRELYWLDYLGDESVNALMFEEQESRGPYAELFRRRVESMMEDISPKALFCGRDGVPFSVFLKELNLDAKGPAKAYPFTYHEALGEAEAYSKTGAIRLFYSDNHKEPMIARPTLTLHPEDCVRWLNTDHNADTTERVEKPDPEDVVSNADTVSTEASIPSSEENLEYTQGMPKTENLRSYIEARDEDSQVKRDREKTVAFFLGLAYRLGLTLRELSAKFAQLKKGRTPAQIEENKAFVKEITKNWLDDAAQRPNNPKKNPKQFGDDRVTPTYRDIVKAVEPESYREDWADPSSIKEEDGEQECAQIVRKGILREAYENKSMLYPARQQQIVDAQGEPHEVTRREPIWSFGHPSRRATAPRFFDINNWPLHLQCKETQRKIKERGPKQGAARASPPPSPTPGGGGGDSDDDGDEDDDDADNDEDMDITEEEQQLARSHKGKGRAVEDFRIDSPVEEVEISYLQRATDRRHFNPGPQEFWGGDTPYQRKAVEDNIRRRLETSKRTHKTWHQRLSGVIFGSKPANDDPTALPEIDPRFIPKSKPREPAPPPPVTYVSVDDDDDEDEEMAYDEAPKPPPTTPVTPGRRRGTSFADPTRLSEYSGPSSAGVWGERDQGPVRRTDWVGLELDDTDVLQPTDYVAPYAEEEDLYEEGEPRYMFT